MEIKKLIKAACGEERSMTEFARDISTITPISPASLYRIAAGNIRTAVNPNLLAAIASKADPQSGVTLEILQTTFNELLATGPSAEERALNKYNKIEKTAQRVVADRLLAGGLKVQKIGLASTNEYLARPGLFDFAYRIERGRSVQTLFFAVKGCSAKEMFSPVKDVDAFVGRVLRMRLKDPDVWYYLVFFVPGTVRDSSRDAPTIDYYLARDLFEEDGVTSCYGDDFPINVGIIVITEQEDGAYHCDEFTFGPGMRMLAFDSVTAGDYD